MITQTEVKGLPPPPILPPTISSSSAYPEPDPKWHRIDMVGDYSSAIEQLQELKFDNIIDYLRYFATPYARSLNDDLICSQHSFDQKPLRAKKNPNSVKGKVRCFCGCEIPKYYILTNCANNNKLIIEKGCAQKLRYL